MAIIDYERNARNALQQLREHPDISDKNKADFERYYNSLDITKAREYIIIPRLRDLFILCDDLVGTMHDRDRVNALYKTLRDKGYSDATIETYKSVGRAFIRWHNEGVTPKGWRDVKSNTAGWKRTLQPDDMVSWEDGEAMEKHTNSTQRKAILFTQLDGGFRPGELENLNYGDIQQRDGVFVARVREGKTGPRDVPLFRCAPYLQRWLNDHPDKRKDAPLWIVERPSQGKTEYGGRYKAPAMTKAIRKIGERAGITKPLDFYNLRHSACALAKKEGLNTEMAAKKFGHTVKYYTETYGRLSTEDEIRRWRAHHGLDEEEGPQIPKPKTCPRCNTFNTAGVEYCATCGGPLTMQAAAKAHDETEALRSKTERLEKRMDLFIKALKASSKEEMREVVEDHL